MASFDDVRRLALALPETDEHPSYGGLPAWRVRGKGFVWERPLRRGELAAVGEVDGPVLGVYTGDLDAKEQVLAEEADVAFTIPHFDGYPAVLIHLDRLGTDRLGELVTDAWLARAPKRLAASYLAEKSVPTHDVP